MNSVMHYLNLALDCCNQTNYGALWYTSNGYVYNGWIITLTSKWAQWRLKSPASRLFTQPFIIQAKIKENITAPHHWPLWGEFISDRWITSNMANVSIWWRHHIRKCLSYTASPRGTGLIDSICRVNSHDSIVVTINFIIRKHKCRNKCVFCSDE